MICPNCQSENPDNAHYCLECGFNFQSDSNIEACPYCGNQNPVQAKFCNECGKSLKQQETPQDKESSEVEYIPPDEKKTWRELCPACNNSP